MHEECKSVLKQAILKSLMVLRELVGQFSQPYLVWSKRSEGQWHGEYQQRPNLVRVYAIASDQLNEAAADFASQFFKNYPEYNEIVGFSRFGQTRLGRDKSYILKSALQCLWHRHGTFECDEAAVDAIVEEFAEFVDGPTVRLQFQAQLLNYRMTASRLALPELLTIRRLSEKEVSALHGGSLHTLGFVRPRSSSIHEFVIEGEHEAGKPVGDCQAHADSPPDYAKERLDKAILSLRTFKEGHVGYDYVHFKPVKFCPLPLASLGLGDLYVPFGSYQISDEEVDLLYRHAELVFGISDPAMEMACNRLADADTRTRSNDRIVDAVIGMEALLLAALGKEDRRGEFKYRFSLHYSTLFRSPEDRYRAFRVAKDLYDLRSKIAHGSRLKDKVFRVGHEKLDLDDAAKRATDALRTVMQWFLPQAKAAPYRRPEFWDRAYFGLPQDRNH